MTTRQYKIKGKVNFSDVSEPSNKMQRPTDEADEPSTSSSSTQISSMTLDDSSDKLTNRGGSSTPISTYPSVVKCHQEE